MSDTGIRKKPRGIMDEHRLANIKEKELEGCYRTRLACYLRWC